MVPPKLTVVPNRQEPEPDAVEPQAAPAAEASEALAHEGWRGLPSNIAQLPSADRREQLRILEALLFAASEPLAEQYLRTHLKSDDDVAALLTELQGFYASRGINLVKVAGKWAFRTAEDLSYLLERHATEQRRLSKAAMETLAIIAYHQPVTRAEIEEIRGVAASAGTLDVLMEIGWVRPRGRRRAPGRPITYGTTRGVPRPLRARRHQGPAGSRRAQGLGPARQQPAARFHGARADGRCRADAGRAAARGRRRGRGAAPARQRRGRHRPPRRRLTRGPERYQTSSRRRPGPSRISGSPGTQSRSAHPCNRNRYSAATFLGCTAAL